MVAVAAVFVTGKENVANEYREAAPMPSLQRQGDGASGILQSVAAKQYDISSRGDMPVMQWGWDSLAPEASVSLEENEDGQTPEEEPIQAVLGVPGPDQPRDATAEGDPVSGLRDTLAGSGVSVTPGDTAGIREAFIRGYRDGGGNEAYLEHFLNVVIPCESRWRLEAISSAGHLGLAQYSLDSWQRAGGGDWRDPYQQGLNTARWVALTIDRGANARSQWSCW